MKTMHMWLPSAVSYGLCFTGAALAVGCVADVRADEIESSVSAAVVLDVNAAYTIVGVQSGKCVGVADESTASEAPLELQTCVGIASQRFQPEPTDSGFFQLRNELSGLCMDVSHVRQNDGVQVIQFLCKGSLNQQWSFTDVGAGAERLTVRHSGKVLDVDRESTADGTKIQQWTWHNGANQQFRLNKALPPIAPE